MDGIEKRPGALNQAERIIKHRHRARRIDIVQRRIPLEHFPGNRIQLIIDADKL